MKRIIFVALLAGIGLSDLQAQSTAPSATQPIREHRAFNAKEPATDWREMNELVRALDGHMGHVKNVQKPLPTAPAKGAKPAAEKTEPKKTP